MNSKQQLGQFFTTNTFMILKGFAEFIVNKNLTDPFAGNGDLLNWASQNGAKSVIGYDIDKNYVDNKRVFFNDSLLNPKKYDFVLTNPPYLYQNKLQNNTILKDSKHTDLYQLSLEKIMNSNEGIVIVPINFLSANNSKYIREIFLSKFEIIKANYFTDQVFNDTTYNVIAFYYKKKTYIKENIEFDFIIYPQNKHTKLKLSAKFNWQIGGDFLHKIKYTPKKINITRLEEDHLISGNLKVKAAYNHLNNVKEFNVDEATHKKITNNILMLKAIDTGSRGGEICLSDIRKYGYEALVSLKTSRNQIHLIFDDNIEIKVQEELIELFNIELKNQRDNYHSLFMTNFRDKNRKRISFKFAYDFINYLYFNKLKDSQKNDKIQPALF
ncbi:MAG: class I SAM-dependent methyltransferase [Alphaproteobacteria bacterium]|jgi:16S rRNA G966 N2-methylase RsmD|nr:class I SAM-dependent methyltransferase [Alphaproteobacteria bacterium]